MYCIRQSPLHRTVMLSQTFPVELFFVSKVPLRNLYYVGLDILGRSLRTVRPESLLRHGIETSPTNDPYVPYPFAEIEWARVMPFQTLELVPSDFPLTATVTFWIRRPVSDRSHGIIPGYATPKTFIIESPFLPNGRPIERIRVRYSELGDITLDALGEAQPKNTSPM